MTTLYLVATPIGNLQDISSRALQALEDVSLIAAEDTRTTRKLLRRYKLKTPLISYYKDNRNSRIPYILDALLRDDVALVSDAGVPAISDPGSELVAAAVEAGFTVTAVPGASSVTTALAVSGLHADRFLFLGFLPNRPKARREALAAVTGEPYTLVIFEAPHRLKASLQDMTEILGDRNVAVCRELTKLYEEIYHGTLSEAVAHFARPKGEFTLVVEGAKPANGTPDLEGAARKLRELKEAGITVKEATAQISIEYSLSRRQIYDLWLKL